MDNLLFVIVGGIIAGVISPILLSKYSEWDRERKWAAPRKKLLKAKLISAKGDGWVSLERLTILSGTNDEDCRSLLMDINARGGFMKSQKEAWALISRQPLTNQGEEIEGAE